MKKDSFFEKKMSFFKMQKFLQKFFVLIQKVMFFSKTNLFEKINLQVVDFKSALV